MNRNDCEAFLDRVRARLAAGAAEYGDRSFTRPTDDLLDEIQQELEDVAGWGAILWARIDRMRTQPMRSAGQLAQEEAMGGFASLHQTEDEEDGC